MGRRTPRTPTPLGKYLEAARDAKGLNQQDAAAAAGFSSGTWSNMIFGGARLRLDNGVVTLRRLRVSDENVRAAAAAVDADVDHALTLDREAITETSESDTGSHYDLAQVPLEVLLAEVGRRYA